nr:helix-turn-helix domain-containing protein [Candidatus Njordarchaeota archaeon]
MKEKKTNETLKTGKRLCHHMDASALSPEELGYLLGLYLTDGCLYKKRKTSKIPTGMNWSFQGDEEGMAERVVTILRKASLNPLVHFSKFWRLITVTINAVNLVDIFPVKKKVLETSVAWKFFEDKRLLDVKYGIPFAAGLIDGDGACQVTYRLRRKAKGGLGSIESQWSFSQNRFPCLCEYLHRFTETLSPNGSTLSTYRRQRKNRVTDEHVVMILKNGMDALLQRGIGRYSWKVERWQERIKELQIRLSLLKSSIQTVGQVARSLGLSKTTVWTWCKMGKVKTLQGGKGAWYLIPSEEVERLHRIRNACTAGQLSPKLGVSVATVSRWCRAGKVKTLCGGKGKKYLIPVEEVERLFQERRKK